MRYLGESTDVDLMVVDVSSGKCSRAEILAFLQADPRYRNLPVVTCDCLHRVRLDHDTMPRLRVKESDTNRSGRPASLLIVDDEQILLGLLARVFRRDGYEVVTACSGREALEKMRKHDVGFVLSDIDMPHMTGLDLLAEVRNETPNMPILMMTGNGSKYDRTMVLNSGADGYLPKPFKNADLLTLIELMSGQLLPLESSQDPSDLSPRPSPQRRAICANDAY